MITSLVEPWKDINFGQFFVDLVHEEGKNNGNEMQKRVALSNILGELGLLIGFVDIFKPS